MPQEPHPTAGENWMRRAIALACEQVSAGGGPFGAVILRDGEIIAEGANQVTLSLDPTAHAEIVAIRTACRKLGRFDLRGCEIYSSCEPCPMCLSAIRWARLDRVYYAADRHDAARIGFDDALLYQELTRAPEEQTNPPVRLLPEEGLAPFLAWEGKDDRVRY